MPHPVPGERRSGATETVEWDGQRWNPVPHHAPIDSGQPEKADSEPDTWWGGFSKSLLDTAKKTGTGIVRGVGDAISSVPGAVQAYMNPGETALNAGRAAAHAVQNPGETYDALKSGVTSLSDPEKGGEAIGNLATMLGVPYLPEAGAGALKVAAPVIDAMTEAPAAIARGVGNATSAVGRGAEALGTSSPASYVRKFGAPAALMHGDIGTAGLAATVPSALEYGGQGLQRLGNALTGLGTPEAEASPVISTNEFGRSPKAKWAQARVSPTYSEPAAPPAPQLSPYEQWKLDNAGTDRTTGSFKPVNALTGEPIGLDAIAPSDWEKLGGSMGGYNDVNPSQTIRPDIATGPPAAPGFSTGSYDISKVPTSATRSGLSSSDMAEMKPSIQALDNGATPAMPAPEPRTDVGATVAPVSAEVPPAPMVARPSSDVGATPASVSALDQLDLFGDSRWPGKVMTDTPDNQLKELAAGGDENAARALRQRNHIDTSYLSRGMGSTRSAGIRPNP